MTRTGACLFTAALLGLGACYASGYSEEPTTGGAASPADAAPPPKRVKKKKKPAQTVRQAWRLICHAEQLSGAEKHSDRSKRGDIVASWLAKNLKNKEVIYWYLSFGKLKQPEQPSYFRAEARKAGFAACPLQKLLFEAPPDAGVGAGSGG
jgi:hypothetical protein